MNAWYNEKPIKTMLDIEIQRCEFLLSKQFGERGAFMSDFFPYRDMIPHHFKQMIFIADRVKYWLPRLVCANYDEIPLDEGYLNCSVLLHVFDFSHHVDAIIAELWRVTAPEGIVIIFGFNPFPLFGLNKFVKKIAKQHGLKRPISPNVLRPKFMHKGFELLEFGTLLHRPCCKNAKLFQRLKFLEIVGEFCWPDLGAIYYYKFKKSVLTITPKRIRFQKLKKIVPAGIAEPT